MAARAPRVPRRPDCPIQASHPVCPFPRAPFQLQLMMFRNVSMQTWASAGYWHSVWVRLGQLGNIRKRNGTTYLTLNCVLCSQGFSLFHLSVWRWPEDPYRLFLLDYFFWAPWRVNTTEYATDNCLLQQSLGQTIVIRAQWLSRQQWETSQTSGLSSHFWARALA